MNLKYVQFIYLCFNKTDEIENICYEIGDDSVENEFWNQNAWGTSSGFSTNQLCDFGCVNSLDLFLYLWNEGNSFYLSGFLYYVHLLIQSPYGNLWHIGDI